MSTRLDELAADVERFAKQRLLLRALTAVKQMMMIARHDPRTVRALARISSPDVRGAPTIPVKPKPPAPHKEGWETIPPGVVLAGIPLVQMLFEVQESEPANPAPSALTDFPFDSEPELPEFPVTPLFSGLDAQGFDLLVDRLKLVSLPKGQVLFRQGDSTKSLFVIVDGSVRVILEKPEQREIAILDAGEFFGEIALIADRPRTATIEALADTDLIEIDAAAVSALLMADPNAMQVLLWFLRDRLVDLLVRTNPLFTKLSHAEGRKLAARFTLIEAKEGSLLIEQGMPGRGLIIVLAGQAEVVRWFGDQPTPIALLGPGDVVGEMSLLSKEPAICSVRAIGRFIALELLADRFEEMMKEHQELRALVNDLAEKRRQTLVEVVEGYSHVDLI